MEGMSSDEIAIVRDGKWVEGSPARRFRLLCESDRLLAPAGLSWESNHLPTGLTGDDCLVRLLSAPPCRCGSHSQRASSSAIACSISLPGRGIATEGRQLRTSGAVGAQAKSTQEVGLKSFVSSGATQRKPGTFRRPGDSGKGPSLQWVPVNSVRWLPARAVVTFPAVAP
jgi:hypothetical protein